MSGIIASATITNDISFTLIRTGANTQSEAGSLGYSRTVNSSTYGTGALGINYGAYASGSLDTGTNYVFDFKSFPKQAFGGIVNISFSAIKGLAVYNQETGYSYDLNIHATGSNALTGLFNGGSGNLLVKPYAVYQYGDPISGLSVSTSHRYLTLKNNSSSVIDWSVIVVGITG